MYGTLPAAAGWQHLVQKVGSDIGQLSSNNRPCASGDGDDHDWLLQKLNE